MGWRACVGAGGTLTPWALKTRRDLSGFKRRGARICLALFIAHRGHHVERKSRTGRPGRGLLQEVVVAKERERRVW